MTAPATAALLLATAVLLVPPARGASSRLAVIGGQPSSGRRSARRPALPPKFQPVAFALPTGTLLAVLSGWPRGIPVGAGAAIATFVLARRRQRATGSASSVDQLGMAATWDLLAACLRAGLPVPTAVLAVSGDLPPEPAAAVRATADLLALGADPVAAWAPALACPDTAPLARGARRTARSGTALAGVAATLAASIRATAGDAAEARAQRAGVLITGPLGLCFLPAFVCLGIVPVVAGLAAQLSIHP